MAPHDYPFAAFPGSEDVKLAMLLLAADPELKGLLIRGGRGSGKTVLARSIRPLLAAGAPFVEVPATVTDDRLLGGIDWSATLKTSGRRVATGLLVRADRGVLYVDNVNLLPFASAAQIAGALNNEVVRLERDGLAARSDTSFVLLGAYDPDEGEPSALLRDSAGLHAVVDEGGSLNDRTEIAARALDFQSDPGAFVARYAAGTACAVDRVRAARRLLPGVTVAAAYRRRLCELAAQLGVEGHRADIFAVLAARAHAALCGRRSVLENDIQVAVRLVLAPRAGSRAGVCQSEDCGANRVSEGPEPAVHSRSADGGEREALPIDNPAPALNAPSGGGGVAAGRGKGRRQAESDAGRGRYVRAVETDPGHGRVAIDATLRAAAKCQKSRQGDGRRVRIAPGDLRFKQFRQKTGIEIIIALDASGSMAANRIQQAKGAIIRLLRDAYVHRDTVALVGFRGNGAEVLMKPGRSVELARRALDELPAGGGTPLASGILLALELAQRSERPALLVLLTDGRPNVSRTGEAVWNELERVAAAVRESKAVPVLIDTSRGCGMSGGAGKLAAMLRARYVELPRIDSAAVFSSVAEAAAAMRFRGWSATGSY